MDKAGLLLVSRVPEDDQERIQEMEVKERISLDKKGRKKRMKRNRKNSRRKGTEDEIRDDCQKNRG